jgi:acetyl esterase/lipase
MSPAYDPAARHELKVWDVEFRRAPARQLLARVYQPQGAGPFPVLLDLHGGAWNNKDRLANAPMDEAVARSGVLVVAVDLSRAPEQPYPAAVQEAHYAVRWLKAKAAQWRGDAALFGVLGSSSGGHIAQLLALMPAHPLYGALPLEGAPGVDARIDYVATRSPISDPYGRHLQALKRRREHMIKNSQAFFVPWQAIHEANPQEILQRGEQQALPPMLIMQGGLDDNVIPEIQQRFAASYRAAGGECELHVFEGCDHEWIKDPGPDTDRAHERVKAFIARNLRALRRAA